VVLRCQHNGFVECRISEIAFTGIVPNFLPVGRWSRNGRDYLVEPTHIALG
jgi:hypothetical protein